MPTGWIIIGRPKDCRYCGNAYYALEHTVEYAISKGFDVIDLAASDDTREKIYEAIDTYDPIYFTGIGHGNTCVYTDNFEQIIWACTYYPPDNLANRVVYLWSCLTGNGLGPSIISHGGKSYIGYTKNWTWLSGSGTDGDPYDDIYARCFFESGEEINRTLFDGGTVNDAVNNAIDKYNEWIDYWMNEGSSNPNSSEMIKWLVWDRDALIQLGDENATIRLKHCSEHTNETECEAHGCYWYNGFCHSTPPKPEDIDNAPDCRKYGYYWYNNACHLYPPVDNIIEFTINLSQHIFGYTAGGLGTTYINIVEQYHLAADTWRIKAPTINIRKGSVGLNIDGRTFIAGGYNGSQYWLSSVEEYVPSDDVWITKTSMDTARDNAGGYSIKGYGYIVSGLSDYGFTGVNERYDPATDTWVYKRIMNTSRTGVGYFTLNDKGYIAGGYASGEEKNYLEEYNPFTDTWSFRTSLNENVVYPGSFYINDYGYVLGGKTASRYHNHNEQYNSSSNTWTMKTGLLNIKAYTSGFNLQNKGYIVGGYSGSLNLYDHTEQYNPITDIWSYKTNMNYKKMQSATFIG